MMREREQEEAAAAARLEEERKKMEEEEAKKKAEETKRKEEVAKRRDTTDARMQSARRDTNALAEEKANLMESDQPDPCNAPDADITQNLYNLNKGEAGHGDEEDMEVDGSNSERNLDQSPRQKKAKKDKKDKKKYKKDK